VETKMLKEMENGGTLMLAREIVERTTTSQLYEKIDDSTVRHRESGETLIISPEEIVVPFDPTYVAKV
jgi:hypothetical protein